MSADDINNTGDSENTTASDSDADVENSPQVAEVIELSPEQDLAQKLEKAEKDFLYLRAEFENFKRNSIKERSQLVRYGGQRLAFDLLNTLDVFTQALEGEITGDNFQQFVDGVKMTRTQLQQTLEKHGVKEVLSMGENFDPAIHEALGTEEIDGFTAGQICRVFKAPYKYHDKLLRAGQVFVAKGQDSTGKS